MAASAAAFACAFSPLAFGQTQQQIEDAKQAELIRRAGENERRIASWELRMAEVRRPPTQRRDATLAYAQIREDYKQIQISNNDLLRLVGAGGPLDLKVVTKSVSDIRNRASRLKENLRLPEPQKTAERPKPEALMETAQIKSSLSRLDALIFEFVNNPIFDHAKTVNIEQAAKARRNLEEIIEISDQIKKSSEKLKTLAQKTP
jgi:hypothetical protein